MSRMGNFWFPFLWKMRLIISKAIDQTEWDLDVLLKAFDSEIEERERCEPKFPLLSLEQPSYV